MNSVKMNNHESIMKDKMNLSNLPEISDKEAEVIQGGWLRIPPERPFPRFPLPKLPIKWL
jgi:hypothetical protein